MNDGFKSGQMFYTLAPGCDKTIAKKIRIDEINLAFASESEVREAYQRYDKSTIDYCVAWWQNYKLGILDTIKRNSKVVPKNLQKLVARFNK